MKKTILWLILVLILLVLFGGGLALLKSHSSAPSTSENISNLQQKPIEDIAATEPTEAATFLPPDKLWKVKWEEFEAMSPSEKELFFDSFASAMEFDQWMQQVKVEQLPWENGGKKPEEYSWEEYDALSPAQKEQFFDAFSTSEAFDLWMQEAQKQVYIPWEDGGKQPWEYTWEEYEFLTAPQKEAFYDVFGTAEAFDAWMRDANGIVAPIYPWENDGKQPEEYTWLEYEQLTPAEKDAFFDSFDSVEAFDMWMQNAQNVNAESILVNTDKKPKDYTWQEYEALEPAQKELFFDSFASLDEFQAWMERVIP